MARLDTSEFQANPNTGQETAFFVTPRSLPVGAEVRRAEVDSPCFRTEADALDFEIPWHDYHWHKIAMRNNKDLDVALVVAVEADSGISFSEGACSGVVVHSRVVTGSRAPRGPYMRLTLHQPPDEDWRRAVAEPFELLAQRTSSGSV